MTRLLALCTGASIGLAVGWLWGSNTSRLVEAHALAADYRRNEGAPMSAERRARLMASLPAQRDTGHGPPPWPLPTGDACPIPAQRDDEPCTVRSPGGGIVCCRTGDHTSHLFPGSHARDRKADADERIE